MKLGTAILFAALRGCAAQRKTPASAADVDVRGSADDLRVDYQYRPAPTGSQSLALSYDHPPRAYYSLCRVKGYDGGYSRRTRPCAYSRRCD